MIELKATIEGDKELSRKLSRIPSKLDDFQKPLGISGIEVRRSVDENFKGRGRLFGKWKKRKDSKSHPLLEKTGKMRHAFKQTLGPGYVEIFNPTPYFKFHQSNKPRKRIPRRVMLKIDNIRKVFIQKEFQRFIQQSLKGRYGS